MGIFKIFFVIKTETGHGRTQNTHTESKKVRLITEMIKICVFTLFFCSIAGKHLLIQTGDRGQDYSALENNNIDETIGSDYGTCQDGEKVPCDSCNTCWCKNGRIMSTRMGCIE